MAGRASLGLASLVLLLAAAPAAAARHLLGQYDPLSQFDAGAGHQATDEFGSSLALVSPSGAALSATSLLAVGAPHQASPKVFVFSSDAVQRGRSWTLNASFDCCPTAPEISTVPYALSFSADGTRLLVGKPGSTGPNPALNNAQLFILDASNATTPWQPSPQDLTCAEDATEGATVAMSGNGLVTWLGDVGSACYTRFDVAPITPKVINIGTNTALSIATSYDGLAAAVGVAGSVYMVANLSLAATATVLTKPAGAAATFGTSISMSSDASKLVVGACGAAVYFYSRNGGGSWGPNPAQTLTRVNSTSFGCPVAIAPDGFTLVVGSVNASGSDGTIFAYRHSLGKFVDPQTLSPAAGNGDPSFGGAGLGVVDGGALVAVGLPLLTYGQVAVLGPAATATASASASATASATSSASASSSASATATATVTATATATAAAVAVPTVSATASATATTTSSATATTAVSASATASASASTSASATNSSSPAAAAAASTGLPLPLPLLVAGGFVGGAALVAAAAWLLLRLRRARVARPRAGRRGGGRGGGAASVALYAGGDADDDLGGDGRADARALNLQELAPPELRAQGR